MARRLLRAIVLFFAVYAFVFVPLGKKTALEHVIAIVTTPAAKQAGSELKGGVEKLVQRLRTEAEQATRDDDPPLRRDLGPPRERSLAPSPEQLRATPDGKTTPRRAEVRRKSSTHDREDAESLPRIDELERLLADPPEAAALEPY
jgi:hypothetical protein